MDLIIFQRGGFGFGFGFELFGESGFGFGFEGLTGFGFGFEPCWICPPLLIGHTQKSGYIHSRTGSLPEIFICLFYALFFTGGLPVTGTPVGSRTEQSE